MNTAWGTDHASWAALLDSRETPDRNKAQAYTDYVRGALKNQYVVGVHWFQYKDQPTTGRGDGENYQIGFVDICDTPYQETIDASRSAAYGLYAYRLKK